MAHLTPKQRYEIGTLRSKGFSMTDVGNFIGKDKSVISRELARNSDLRNNVYKAELAQAKTNKRHTDKHKRINGSLSICGD